MFNNKFYLLPLCVGGLLTLATSCVPKKQLVASQSWVSRLQSDSAQMSNRISNLEKNVIQLQDNIATLEQARAALQNQLRSTRGELDATRSEATSKLQDASQRLNMSQQQIAEQQQKLQQLQELIDQQRMKTEALRKKISDALVSFNSNELTVSTKNGKVYVSLQENLLFPSGSAEVNPKGKDALSKLADVLNLNPNINVNIEGHTDSIPIKGRYIDNWDLSTARANAIVRILTNTYNVDATRVTASGHSKYDPVDTNLTSQGRAKNRRTEIILEPKLDELMQLIQSGSTEGAGG